jgi:hypothetical protein
MSVGVELVSAPTPEPKELLAELDQILGTVYEPHQRHALSIDQLFSPGSIFSSHG